MENENDKTPQFLKNNNVYLNQNISRPPIKNYDETQDDICNFNQFMLSFYNSFFNK